MKRKTSTTPTKIWSFRAYEPTDNRQLFHEQLFQASRYYNTLIEIERKRRDAFRAARAEAVPELAALEIEWQHLDTEYEAALKALPKAPKGKRTPLSPEASALKERRKQVSAQMKALRAKFASADIKEQLKHVDEAAQLAIKAARAATPVYWGSYLLIENQMEQVRKSKKDPRFRRFDGGGRVGVQLQGGLTTSDLLSGEDTRLQLLPLPPQTKLRPVRIRIGSEGRAPIWATLPVLVHRELPADAVIKWAWIKVRDWGGRRHYELQLAMESESFALASDGSGTAAINFGWRANDDGSRRVAYLVDDRGHEEKLDVPENINRSFDLATQLRSSRDLHFEEAKRAVVAFRALHPDQVPEWMEAELQNIVHWRNPKRLEKIARRLVSEHREKLGARPSGRTAAAERWRQERLGAKPQRDLFAPAAEIMSWLGRSGLVALAFYLELWFLKNRHLREWECDARERALGHRKEIFRRWVKRVAGTYATIRVEDFDLREFAEIPAADEEQRPKSFRVSRAVAAPGELRELLVSATGSRVVVSDAHHNTVRCYECEHLNERALTHRMTCARCGETWDQDANNCRNQLRERQGGSPGAGGARNSGKPPQDLVNIESPPSETNATPWCHSGRVSYPLASQPPAP